jgi:UDP-N-acetylglucosamine 1-carboxyvinyltransferase
MDRLLVRPNGPLSGRVAVHGAKNSVLKCMAGCLLATGRHRIANVPAITDVSIMADVLAAMGASTTQSGRGTDGTLEIEVPNEITPIAPYELVERIRASIVVLGPLLARYGWARMSLPGGDDFGGRSRSSVQGLRPSTATSRVAATALSEPASCSNSRATPRPTTSSWRQCSPGARQ